MLHRSRWAGSIALVAAEMVVLVLTDVVGSTRLWADFPNEMNAVMARHHEIVQTAVAGFGGWRPVDQGEGDAVFAAFESASAAVRAVVEFQRLLETEPWPEEIQVRDRVGIHVGEVTVRDGNLFGLPVARTARIRSLGAGGQVLLSAPVYELVRDALPPEFRLADLGEHRMKDLARAERIYELSAPGMAQGFPPLASLNRVRTNLPVQSTGFFGRESEVAELCALVARERLTTIVGFGGMGKTRLALQVAAELGDGDGDGVWFVDLAAVTEADRIPSAIASAVGADLTDAAIGPLVDWLEARRLLLLLDNLEQLLPDAAAILERIVSGAPEVRILATSREAVRIRSEQVYGLEPLPVPPRNDDSSPRSVAEIASLSAYAAVSMFLARASAVRRDFELTPSNAAAVAAICSRLDGLPLALELAAARLRALSPEALLPRLENALKVLTHGSRDLPTRQQTLRATIAWSFDALSEEEQGVLARLSVFPSTFSLEAAEAVAGDADDGVDVLDAVTGLVERSVARLHAGAGPGGDDRYDLLVSIRDFGREQLALREGIEAMASRHAAWVVRLCEALRHRLDDRDEKAVGLFNAETENIDSALRWLLEQGTGGAEDAKRLIVAARSSYVSFLPSEILWERIDRLRPDTFRGGRLDVEVIALAMAVGYYLDFPDERRRWLAVGLRLCDADPQAEWSTSARLSLLVEETDLLLDDGDLEAVRAAALVCLQQAAELGVVDVQAKTLNQLVDLTEYEGAPEEGLMWATRYVDFVEHHRIVQRRINAQLALVFALLELNRIDEAAAAHAAAAELAESIGSPYDLAWLAMYEGRIELERGRLDLAAAAFAAADSYFERFPFPEGSHRLRQACIGIPAARGDWPEVDRLLAALPLPSEVPFAVAPLPQSLRALIAARPGTA